MAASLILELDALEAQKKILTEIFDTDKHAQASVVYINGAIASTTNPLPIAATGVLRAGAIDAAEPGLPMLALRQDTIATITEANATSAVPRTDENGALRVYLNSALSADTDAVIARPYSPGATVGYYAKRFTAQADEICIAAPGAAARIVITNCRISCRGTTAGQITVYADADADTAFDAGERVIADDNYAPTVLLPMGSKSGPLYIECGTNKPVAVESSAAISFTLMLDYFVEVVP